MTLDKLLQDKLNGQPINSQRFGLSEKLAGMVPEEARREKLNAEMTHQAPENPWPKYGPGLVDFATGMIPVYGSGRDAAREFSDGNWGWGAFDTAMAGLDVATLGGSAVAKGAAMKAFPAIAGTFIGRKGAGNLGKGELMDSVEASLKSGESYPGRVWNDHLMMKSPVDGKMRLEIDDSNAKLTLDNAREQGLVSGDGSFRSTLGDMLEHPELFAALPEMRKLPVFVNNRGGDSYNGFYVKSDGESLPYIGMHSDLLNDPERFRSVLMHETQHGVQDREGFSGGGNPTIAPKLLRDSTQRDMTANADASINYELARDRYNPASAVQRFRNYENLANSSGTKPSRIHRMSDWYSYSDEIRGTLGAMPKKPGDARDRWMQQAFGILRDKSAAENADKYGSRTLEPLLTMDDRELRNLISRSERALDKNRAGSQAFDTAQNRLRRVGQMEPTEIYRRIGGEGEARLVQERLDLPMDGRRENNPANKSQWGGVPRQDLFDVSGLGRAGDVAGAIDVSHGSPHTFDQFDFSKMGTGEGAQAYGNGGYFAEGFDSPVAKGYQETTSNRTPLLDKNPIDFSGNDAASKAIAEFSDNRGDVGRALDMLKATGQEEAHRWLIGNHKRLSTDPGNLYNVSLKWPDAAREASDPLSPDHFLQWDKPFSEQPEGVRNSLLKVNDPFINEAINTQPQLHESGDYWTHLGNTYDSRAEALDDATPQQVVTGSRGGFSSPQDVSAKFSEAGIPGIRYLDQGSRINGDGTHNFVVFNDDLTNIVSRNGQPINAPDAPQQLLDYNDPAVRQLVEGQLRQTKGTIQPTDVQFEIARRNATLPVEQGGLGLPADHTPLDRADALGNTTPAFHSTLQDRTGFNPHGKFMGHTGVSGVSVTDNPEMASRYLDRFGEYGWVDGVPNQPFDKNVMPLLVREGNSLEATQSPYRNGQGVLGAPLPEGYQNPMIADGVDTLILPDAISRKGPVKHSDAKNAIRGNEMVIAKPENIRSRFAAFDPARRNENNLMAGVLAAPVALMDFNQEPPKQAEPQDLSFQFNTPLTPAEQAQFQLDMGDRAKDGFDYDLQGFWKAGGRFDGRGHATDVYKKPNHPTFSRESQYSNFATPGGQWSGGIPENSAFTPSETNLNNLGTDGLQSYFDQVEPGAKLKLPAQRKNALSDIFTR
jgi:hypothetical protein